MCWIAWMLENNYWWFFSDVPRCSLANKTLDCSPNWSEKHFTVLKRMNSVVCLHVTCPHRVIQAEINNYTIIITCCTCLNENGWVLFNFHSDTRTLSFQRRARPCGLKKRGDFLFRKRGRIAIPHKHSTNHQLPSCLAIPIIKQCSNWRELACVCVCASGVCVFICVCVCIYVCCSVFAWVQDGCVCVCS